MFLFPSGASSLTDHPWWFALLAAAGLVTSFTSTLMFTALGSFYTRISDPDMGGSYLTLLNTIANMGEALLCLSGRVEGSPSATQASYLMLLCAYATWVSRP